MVKLDNYFLTWAFTSESNIKLSQIPWKSSEKKNKKFWIYIILG